MYTFIKEYFFRHETKFMLVVGFVLVTIVSFEAGYLKGKSVPDSLVVIEKPSQSPKTELRGREDVAGAIDTNPNQNVQTGAGIDKNENNCILVGSKNSDKYHKPTCQWAKRIKEENRVCFESEEDAKSKGYQPDKSCIK